MKAVILVRHAKASPRELPIPDKERPLRLSGKEDLALLRNVLTEHPMKPDCVFSSTANRAAQTAVMLAGFYGLCDSVFFYDMLYGASAEELIDFIRNLDEGLETVMVVGHNPEIMEIADLLCRGGFDSGVPTSACICLSFDADTWQAVKRDTGVLEFFEFPKKHRR